MSEASKRHILKVHMVVFVYGLLLGIVVHRIVNVFILLAGDNIVEFVEVAVAEESEAVSVKVGSLIKYGESL